MLNEGRVAGSSLPHSHSQLFWLREPPPAASRSCPGSGRQLRRVRGSPAERLEIALRGDVAAFAAPAGRAPYELVLAPSEHAAEPSEADLVDAALLLATRSAGYARPKGPVPLNAWLHTGGHWHIELVPRLTVFAGLELARGSTSTHSPPEEAAQRLRA